MATNPSVVSFVIIFRFMITPNGSMSRSSTLTLTKPTSRTRKMNNVMGVMIAMAKIMM